MTEQAEIFPLKVGQPQAEKSPEDTFESLLIVIEQGKKKLLGKIKRKRKKLVKFVEKLGEDFEAVTAKWSTSFVTVSLAAGIFLTTAAPITAASIPKFEIREVQLSPSEKENLRQKIVAYLAKFGKRKKVNYQLLASVISKITGLPTTAILDGKKIPAVTGEIATEKHLMIYPGEKILEHLKNPDDFAKYHWVGMSPTASAWGYFAQNKNDVSPDLVEKEKYYLVIQTFAAEDWVQQWPDLKEWYKFRKLLVYNPENGKAVVGVIADAGPAKFTGRAFGGSPEVMEALGLSQTLTQGDVLAFFLDDPGNLIPLGPVLQ